MPRFKSIIIYQNSPKTELFLKKKIQNFQALGYPPPDPHNSPSPIAHFWLRACHTLYYLQSYGFFFSFCFEQFFLDRLVANFLMLTIAVCLVLHCFLFEKFYLHYALCDSDSILLHCTKLFIRQGIDREQNFDVTFQNSPIEKSCLHH